MIEQILPALTFTIGALIMAFWLSRYTKTHPNKSTH